MEGMRINKYLGAAGACSRREADRRIAAGDVTIDGKTAELGAVVMPGQKVCLNGKTLTLENETILLALNKPKGIVCTTAKDEENNVVDYINYPKRIYPIGRLDKDSEGLLLLTNNGEIVNPLMRGSNGHEKEYIVTVNRPLTDDFIRRMSQGVYLEELDVTTKKCTVMRIAPRRFRIVLTQGLNRQIRRMCEAMGYYVEHLIRVRIANITVDNLAVGEYRKLTKAERKGLMRLIEHSPNERDRNGRKEKKN